MNIDIPNRARILRTLVVVLVAILLASALWWHYMRSPWTRDGRIRAEIVDVSAEIAGKVVDLKVVDNQLVHQGDPLFVVDPDNYRLMLAQAEATVQSRESDLKIRQEELKRRQALGSQAISTEDLQTAVNAQTVALANQQLAVAARDVAQLNMNRTTVLSPVDGYVTNLHLRVGDYATPGQTKLSVIDVHSFWVVGYFEETKLPGIHIGDFAEVKLMGVGPAIKGHVESLSRGIADSNGGASGQGLATVNPIFTWVRLAQRIPVRIKIDHIPDGVEIAAGQTCTVVLSVPKK